MSLSKKFSLISSVTKSSRGIGFKNTLPWKNTTGGKEDMAYFSNLTKMTNNPHSQNAVIMGRNTWESIPDKFKPLPNRLNIILSKTLPIIWHTVSKGKEYDMVPCLMENNRQILNAYVYPNLDSALEYCYNSLTYNYNDTDRIQQIFVIGGDQVFREAISRDDCQQIFLTELDDTSLPNNVNNGSPYTCDTFFPELHKGFKLINSYNVDSCEPKITFKRYQNMYDYNSQEFGYLNLLKDIMTNGEDHSDRTGVGIKSVFGRQLRFSLSNGVIPLMTTKKTFFKGIVEELLFFLRGDHDNRILQNVGVHIWDGNTSREYLDKYNKHHIQEHDLGLAYGVQWRAAGAKLGNIDTDYRGKGIDQIADVIKQLKETPDSRRIIINAWNVAELEDMALVPCHTLYQFYVSKNRELSCMMTQRSCDVFLGIPFNIASTAILTRVLAQTCGMIPGEIIINLGNTHIYNSHYEQVEKQLQRIPYKFPTLDITKNLETLKDIEQLTFEDFKLNDYHCHPGIKADMAV
jgi:dihydrofolate reductase/thymidylate synthase